MHCATCPTDRRAACMSEGCYARLADLRVATVVGPFDFDLRAPIRLEPGQVVIQPAPAADDMDRQISRLDLEENDLVVVRTRSKLSAEKSARWQDGLETLIRAQGWRNVGVLILDDCTDIVVERAARPATRLVQQSRDVPQPMQGC